MSATTTADLRERLADAALQWARHDATVRAETKSFRDLIHVCEFYEAPEPSDPATGYPGYDGVATCWWRHAIGSAPQEICGPCATHGDRREMRRAAMAKREGAKRRLRRLAAQINALQEGR